MQGDPRIAVAMSVHQAASCAHLRQAIDSLFAQDYRCWFLFLFCDGPLSSEMDNCLEAQPRDRVRVMKSGSNIGLAAALNRTIEEVLAEGGFHYLARMDADDISTPERFGHQVRYLEANPGIGLLGTWCREIDSEGRVLFEKRLPTDHNGMLRFMALRNPLVHPSVMARMEVFHDGVRYAPELRQMQDYELWSRLASRGVQMANLPEFLLLFRRDDDFFARRGGWRRAWRDVALRLNHMRTFRLFSLRNLALLTGIFALRVAPSGSEGAEADRLFEVQVENQGKRMCGLAGHYELHTSEGQENRCRAMLDGIIHRGPDDEGIWSDGETGIRLGFRRLAILELGPAGHQPMQSHSGRFVIVFNGEIYNTDDLRRELESERGGGVGAIAWRGHSDTETLLECVEAWGIQRALRAFKGMFAFALVDRQERTLTLARDRFGEKPLYWGWHGQAFLFGSELKALRRYPGFKGEVEPGAVGSFLARGYVPSPQSIFRGIQKLLPGCYLTLPLKGQRIVPEVHPYWSILEIAKAGQAQSAKLMGERAVDALDRVLMEAVRRQMLSDVPLGAFLSGGVDSSLIVAMMSRLASKPVQTFTLGFQGWGFDEAGFAKAVASRLGTEHEELYITEQDALAVVPDMPGLSDEPFSDTSQLPTLLLCKLARTRVAVALSGDGGDELFGGYNRYFLGVDLWDRSRVLPRWLRGGISHLGSFVPDRLSEFVVGGAMRMLPERYRVPQASEKLHKGLRAIGADTLAEVSALLLEKWNANDLPTRTPDLKALSWPDLGLDHHTFSPVETLMLIDAMTYLPDDILVKVDRAAMANSLETRAPFLDPDVCAFAWGLPLGEKVRDREGKRVLKALLERYLPGNDACRPKSGFGLPVSPWLRGPLRGWAEDLLFQSDGALSDFVDMPRVRALWGDHLRGRNSLWEPLWTVLMLGGWLEQNRRSCAP